MGWSWDEDTPSERDIRMAGNSLRLAGHVAALVGRCAATGLAAMPIDRALILELHAIAMAGDDCAGTIRTKDNQIGRAVVLFQPPPWQVVEEYLEAAFTYLETARESGATTLHLAAYALWRMCWIHPFDDGNGRTARALSYTILCVGYGRELPGVPTVPEQIVSNRLPYWDALKSADRAVERGVIDVSEMETLLGVLLERQVRGSAT